MQKNTKQAKWKTKKRRRRNPLLEKHIKYVDYKNVELLEKFINAHGKILSPKITCLTAIQQRNVARAIKRARFMALIPFYKERIRR